MKRKYGAIILSAALVMSMMLQSTFLVNKAQAAPNFIEKVNADFNSYNTPGKTPEGFQELTVTESEILPAEFVGISGKCVKLNSENKGTTPDLKLRKDLTAGVSGTVVIETRIMAADKNFARMTKITSSTAATFSPVTFHTSGEIRDSSAAKIMNFETNKWYRVFIFLDFNKKTYKAGILSDGNFTYSKELPITLTDLKAFEIYQKRGVLGTTYIDDVRIWSQAASFDVVSPELADTTPKDLQPTFNFEFNTEVDFSSLSNISVANSVYSVTYDEAAPYSCKVTFNSLLTPLTSYDVSFNGVKDIFGNQINKTFSFTTKAVEQPKVFIIGTPTFTKGFGPQKVSITKLETGLINGNVNVLNTTGSVQKATLIMALYKEGSLTPIDIVMVEGNMQNGENTLSASFTVPDDGGKYYIKTLVWKDMLSMEPLTDAKLFDGTGIH